MSEFPKTMYRPEYFGEGIEAVTVLTESAKYVTIEVADWGEKRPRRYMKDGRQPIFPTWQECHQDMILRKTRAVEQAQSELDRARSKLAKIKAMVQP